MIYLEMNHVRKSFGDLEVLKDISLKVEEGDDFRLVGISIFQIISFGNIPCNGPCNHQ